MKPVASPSAVWIDLDNSPHVPFFAPIIEELERRGYKVHVTARDAYQVFELADFFHLKYTLVGRHYGKHKLLKVLGTCFRSLQLLRSVGGKRFDLAVSHGSRSQLLLASLLGIPSVCIFDYEFTSSLKIIAPTWLMAPRVVAQSAKSHKGSSVLAYPGLKEDVYAPRFRPDASIQKELGLEDHHLVVTVRPPATEAHYHNPEANLLLDAVMERLSSIGDAKIILLPRNARQAASLREMYPALFASGKAMIPARALDGLNLIWHSDVVVSGGGTMNREAAALGVPVYSIFRGKIGAVDRDLADTGRLVLLESVADVKTKLLLERRERVAQPQGDDSALATVVGHITRLAERKHVPETLPEGSYDAK